MAKQHLVKCKFCGQTFDTNTVPFIKPSSNRYAHKACAEKFKKEQDKKEKDKKELFKYINKLFNGSYNIAGVNRYLKKYLEEYNYTYTGILKSLIYFYEVKGNTIEKANGNIGIVPYVYNDAFCYYRSIWEAQQKNEGKKVEEYLPEEKIIKIKPPDRKIKTRKFFTFLDEEEIENGNK